MRRKKLLLNTVTAIANQLITLICGLILPRLIISHYGSATNGLLSSITQFLAFSAMMEMGVGAVVRASLYKPIADGDNEGISKVLISSKRFFSKIGMMLLIYSVALMLFFPIFVDNRLGFVSTALLVGAIAFNSICNYLFGIIYIQLLNADQKSYVQLFIAITTTVLNTAFSIVLINLNASIVEVKLVASVVLLLKPILLRLYVNKHYHLNLKLELTEEPLKQKWNGLAQHLATYVLKHADTVILTIFSTLENVSIYYVYHLVTNGLQQMIEVLTTGIASLLGDMYAKHEQEKLHTTFSAFEWIIHTFVTLVYVIAGIMILPFVQIYTKGVTDANYIVPIFSFFIVIANAAYCIRMPYNIMIHAAGHFKETQTSAIVEAALNVVVSVLLVWKFGLVGVAIGTLVAMCYRTIYLAWYLKDNILNHSFLLFIKHVIVDILSAVLIVVATRKITMTSIEWLSWVIMGIKVGIIAFLISLTVNIMFYRPLIKDSLRLLFRKRNK